MSETMTMPDVAQELKISVSSVWRLIQRGHLTAYRAGKLIRIRKSAVDKYIVDEEKKYAESLKEPAKKEEGARPGRRPGKPVLRVTGRRLQNHWVMEWVIWTKKRVYENLILS